MTGDLPDVADLIPRRDVEMLLADVRRQGLEMARVRLVEAYADALVRAVVSQQHAVTAEKLESSAATGCYVYAVVAGDGTGAAGAGAGIEPGGAVRVVTVGDISAVVSDVDLNAMRAGGSCDEIAEDGWLARAVRAHEHVVLTAFHSAPTVPMRFGIVHPDQYAVERLLTAHALEFREELRRITGAAEWSVRVYVDQDVLAKSARRPAADDSEVESGTAYLLRERTRREQDDRVRTAVQHAVEDLTTTLAGVAGDAVATPQVAVEGRTAVFSAAYLVDRGDEHRLAAVIDAFNAGAGDSGLVADLAGPWPPYHFTRLRLEADSE